MSLIGLEIKKWTTDTGFPCSVVSLSYTKVNVVLNTTSNSFLHTRYIKERFLLCAQALRYLAVYTDLGKLTVLCKTNSFGKSDSFG